MPSYSGSLAKPSVLPDAGGKQFYALKAGGDHS
jgi:hypothetical protein